MVAEKKPTQGERITRIETTVYGNGDYGIVQILSRQQEEFEKQQQEFEKLLNITQKRAERTRLLLMTTIVFLGLDATPWMMEAVKWIINLLS